jgi:hypothetical protein
MLIIYVVILYIVPLKLRAVYANLTEFCQIRVLLNPPRVDPLTMPKHQSDVPLLCVVIMDQHI